MDKYFDQSNQLDFDHGRRDGLDGHMDSRKAKNVNAYMSGFFVGIYERELAIRKKRLINIAKARNAKNKKEDE
jgi:hypothetical protein